MTKPALISYEDVASAAAALAEQGASISARAVYAALGQRGSMKTINDHLRAYRDASAVVEDLSQVEVPDFLKLAVAQAWQQAQAAATAGHEALRKELLAAAARLKEVEADHDEIVAELTAQRDAEAERADVAERDKEHALKAFASIKEAAAKLEHENELLRERLSAAQDRVTRADAARAAAEKLAALADERAQRAEAASK